MKSKSLHHPACLNLQLYIIFVVKQTQIGARPTAVLSELTNNLDVFTEEGSETSQC